MHNWYRIRQKELEYRASIIANRFNAFIVKRHLVSVIISHFTVQMWSTKWLGGFWKECHLGGAKCRTSALFNSQAALRFTSTSRISWIAEDQNNNFSRCHLVSWDGLLSVIKHQPKLYWIKRSVIIPCIWWYQQSFSRVRSVYGLPRFYIMKRLWRCILTPLICIRHLLTRWNTLLQELSFFKEREYFRHKWIWRCHTHDEFCVQLFGIQEEMKSVEQKKAWATSNEYSKDWHM